MAMRPSLGSVAVRSGGALSVGFLGAAGVLGDGEGLESAAAVADGSCLQLHLTVDFPEDRHLRKALRVYMTLSGCW
jgi:hypothetical protein